jgi:hypothetical protein
MPRVTTTSRRAARWRAARHDDLATGTPAGTTTSRRAARGARRASRRPRDRARQQAPRPRDKARQQAPRPRDRARQQAPRPRDRHASRHHDLATAARRPSRRARPAHDDGPRPRRAQRGGDPRARRLGGAGARRRRPEGPEASTTGGGQQLAQASPLRRHAAPPPTRRRLLFGVARCDTRPPHDGEIFRSAIRLALRSGGRDRGPHVHAARRSRAKWPMRQLRSAIGIARRCR